MTTGSIGRNAAAAVTQVVVGGLSLFLLYAFLIRSIGVEALGIWSVVYAAGSASRVSEFGLSGSVLKYVARHLARDEMDRAVATVESAFVVIAVVVAIFMVAAYWPLGWILEQVVAPGSLPLSRELLAPVLASVWLIALGNVFLMTLDGCQRIDLRSYVVIVGHVAYLALALVLVPVYGLMGLVAALLLQALLIIALAAALAKKLLPGLAWLPWRWRRDALKEMAGYGASLQFITVVAMLFEPVTKALLARFGGLEMTGYYEMANRMVTQLRAVLVAALQVLVPVFARLGEKRLEDVRALYRKAYSHQLFVAIPFFAGIVLLTPLVSELWIGHREPLFTVFAFVLTGAWFVNVLNAPAYFANLGSGRLRWNVIAHLAIGTLNAVLGWLLGVRYGGYGVVAAWALALVAGSVLVPLAYHRENRLPFKELLPRRDRVLALGCVAALAAGIWIYDVAAPRTGIVLAGVLCVSVFLAAYALVAWRDPRRVRMQNAIRGVAGRLADAP